ncbi:MAG: NUDIX domain-containing protein [bacterium]|nr:NUDIX domain-containing protein [bacterium]
MEYFEIVDINGNIIGSASREECHRNPTLLHRVSHVFVFNSNYQLYLQKRSIHKDIQPGKWDTSVGGHLNPGETHEQAACRELAEELGITGVLPIHLYDYTWRSERESELVRTFKVVYDGLIKFDKEEIDEGRFWTLEEIQLAIPTNILTPNFIEEYNRYLNHLG